MTDPIADLIAEEQLEKDTEREERRIVLQRLNQLLDKLDELQQMEAEEQKPNVVRGFTITITERDENGQIKAIRISQ